MRNLQRRHDDSEFNSGPDSAIGGAGLPARSGKNSSATISEGAREEAHLLLIEPAGTPNTGDAATAAPRKTA
jgi:hypothetical protein